MKKKQCRLYIQLLMKITVVQICLAIICTSTLFAKNAHSQDILEKAVNISIKNASINKVISLVHKQTGVKFLYSSDLIQTSRKMDLDAVNKKLRTVLDETFAKYAITYRVMENRILLYPSNTDSVEFQPTHYIQQNPAFPIRGIIRNENNEAVANASVTLKGTSLGTTTTADGSFSLNIPHNNDIILVITHIEYEVQELAVNGRQDLTITLVLRNNNMNEVVVVGYGRQRKSDLTGSVSVISAKDFEKQPIVRVEDALKARAAGVQVQTPSGAPGTPMKIRIRGSNSINGNNEPLYVIDGFIGGDIRTLNPSDISSIDILKDASSTAIFGSRGANGVVIITTKKGYDGKSSIGVDAFYNLNTITKKFDLLNGWEYMENVNEQNIETGLGAQFTQAEIDAVRANGGTDWQDEVLRNGAIQNYQLSYSGGSEKTKVYLSGNVASQRGIIINSDYTRYGLRANINTTVNKKIDFTFNFNGTFQKSKNNYTYNGRNTPYGQALVFSPNVPIIDPVTNDYSKSPSYGPVADNPVFMAKEWNFDNNHTDLLSNIQVNYKILPDLTFSVGGGINGYQYSNPFFRRNIPETPPSTSSASYSNGISWSYQNTNQLTYQKNFNNKHRLIATAIYEQQVSTSKTNGGYATNFSTIALRYNNMGLGSTQLVNSGFSEWSLQSYLGRVNYTFNDKYLFTATFRADGSSKFQGDNKYGYFPSGAVAWKLSEESFIQNLNIFSELKIRGSYGLTGSQAISPYQTLNVLATGRNYPYNGESLQIGIGPGAPGNPNLKWETTEQTDIGIDAGFFNGRLNITADYYNKKTTDLLLYVIIPAYNGGGQTLKNVGSMRNKGFEFMINSTLVDKKDFNISTTINASFFSNRVLNLGADQEIFTTGGYAEMPTTIVSPFILKVGEPIGQFRGLISEGVWQEKDAAQASLFGNKPGDARYSDLNGDNKIDGADVGKIGSMLPKYSWGWNTTVEFKNWDLNIFLNSVGGNDIWNVTRWQPLSPGGDVRNPTSREIENRWTSTNTNTDIPAFSSSSVQHAQQSRFIEDATFIRLNNLSLGYTMSQRFLQKRGIQQMRFYAGGQNLFLITKYKGLDPELSTAPPNTDIAQGIDNLTYPSFRTFTIGIKMVL